MVSINGRPCAGLSHPQVVELMESVLDSLHLLVKRYSAWARARVGRLLPLEASWGRRGKPAEAGALWKVGVAARKILRVGIGTILTHCTSWVIGN